MYTACNRSVINKKVRKKARQRKKQDQQRESLMESREREETPKAYIRSLQNPVEKSFVFGVRSLCHYVILCVSHVSFCFCTCTCVYACICVCVCVYFFYLLCAYMSVHRVRSRAIDVSILFIYYFFLHLSPRLRAICIYHLEMIYIYIYTHTRTHTYIYIYKSPFMVVARIMGLSFDSIESLLDSQLLVFAIFWKKSIWSREDISFVIFSISFLLCLF